MMFPDTAEITPATKNAKTGFETKGTPFVTRCFWEESERLMYKADGTPWRRENLYYLPRGTDVKEGYYIKPLTRGAFSVVGVAAKVQSAEYARGIPHMEAST